MAKILAIDDNIENLAVIQSLCRTSLPEIELLTAHSGSAGIERAREAHPNVILLDIMMPNMDGFEVCRKLKVDPELKDIPVIMITATRTDGKSRVKGLELGADAFLSKPIQLDEMVAQIKVMLRINAAENALRYEKRIMKEKVIERTATQRASESKYRELVETSLDGICMLDMDGRFIDSNQAAQDMLGYTHEELAKLRVQDIVHNEDVQKSIQYMEKLQRDAFYKGYEGRVVTKSGEIRVVQVSSIAIKTEGVISGSYDIFRDVTDFKLSEEVLAESEKRYRTLVESAPVGIVSIDTQGNIISANPKILEILGSPSLEATMQINLFQFEPLNRIGVSAAFQDVIKSGKSIQNESEYTSKGNKTAYLNYKISPIYEYPGKVIGAQALIDDVTDRKLTELVLNKQFQRQEKLLETVHSLGSTLDISIVLGNVCRETLSLLDCQGVTVYLLEESGQFLRPAASQYPNQDEDIMASRVDIENSLSGTIVKSKKGKIFNNAARHTGAFHVPGTAVADTDNILVVPLIINNDVIGTLNLFRAVNSFSGDDLVFATTIGIYVSAAINNAKLHQALQHEIQDRKISEKALRESEERFKTTFYTSPDAIAINRLNDGCYIDINEGFTLVTGYSREETIGKTSIEINMWHNLKDRWELIRGIKRWGHYVNLEANFLRKDGSVVTGLMSASVIDLEGVPHILSITRDISERKSIEQDRITLEAQLRQSHKLEAVGTMVGGIAHELNNILQGMFLYGGLIAADLPDNELVQSNMQHLMEGGERAKAIVNQILTFSRKSAVEMKPQYIQEFVAEALLLERASFPSTIEIQQDIDLNCGLVLCDKTQIHQIVINLCNNAQHAMGVEGGILKVSLQQTRASLGKGEAEVDVVELKLSDTGFGIEPADLDKIFDPFFTTKQFGQGTGLGLSVIHGIVEMMSAEIKVSSKFGEGTIFTIHFPVTEIIQEKIPSKKFIPPATSSQSILLVDDEDSIRVTTQTILSNVGFKVDNAANGKQALKLFRANPEKYDLIVTDLTMPEMSGLEMSQEIRESGSLTPIILSTGHLGLADKREYQDMGITEFIQKPWKAEVLIERINRIDKP